MNNISFLITAFLMGFVGSLHCAGMCGPIALILPFNRLDGWRRWGGFGWYHAGRISVYAVMGLGLHSFSRFFHPQWQQYVSLSLGVLLLLGGILTFYTAFSGLRLPWMKFVQQQSYRFIGRTDMPSLFVAGSLNGLLPCGLVYMALSAAATAPSVLMALLAMYAFGLGTLPMLLAISLLKKRVPLLQKPSLRLSVPLMLLLFGTLLVLRGMNLGVPYLSPRVTTTEDHQPVSSCCHRKP